MSQEPEIHDDDYYYDLNADTEKHTRIPGYQTVRPQAKYSIRPRAANDPRKRITRTEEELRTDKIHIGVTLTEKNDFFRYARSMKCTMMFLVREALQETYPEVFEVPLNRHIRNPRKAKPIETKTHIMTSLATGEVTHLAVDDTLTKGSEQKTGLHFRVSRPEWDKFVTFAYDQNTRPEPLVRKALCRVYPDIFKKSKLFGMKTRAPKDWIPTHWGKDSEE